jgi:hypothetical protein
METESDPNETGALHLVNKRWPYWILLIVSTFITFFLGAGKTVLIVDDNASIRKMLAAAFLSDGFKTCADAENGKQIAPWRSAKPLSAVRFRPAPPSSYGRNPTYPLWRFFASSSLRA